MLALPPSGRANFSIQAVMEVVLGRDVRLADNAVRKLEQKEKRTKSVKGR